MATKKGQAAIEYIGSYSWAVVAILVVGVALWQLGALEPLTNPTGGAVGFSQVRPLDWSCSTGSDEVRVEWINSAGIRIKVTVPQGRCTYKGVTYTAGESFNVSKADTVLCAYTGLSGCSDVSTGDRFESQVTLTWEPAGGGISHTESGSVWRTAE